MALQQSGTQLIVKGLTRFLSDLGKVNRAYEDLGNSIDLNANQIEAFGARLIAFTRRGRTYTQWWDETTKQFLSSEEVIGRFESKLGELGAAVAAAGGATPQLTTAMIGLNLAIVAVRVSINVAVKLIQGFINIVKGAVNIVLKLSSAIIALGKGAFQLLSRALGVVLSPFKKFVDLITDIVKGATAFLLRDAILAVGRALSSLRDDIVSVAAEFQTLTIQIENLIARELQLADATTTHSQALEAAIPRAQELLGWIRALSLQVPFDVDVIARTTAFSQAMGFTVPQAKILTETVGAFTAAMGLSSEKMEQIILNFGQMKAAGKVTGTEMRDLARGALFPLTRVLDETARLMGIAVDDVLEFRKAAARGEVDINAFFQAFVNVVREDFPDALERMGRTFRGVQTRLRNFFRTIIGLEVLGPIFQKITDRVADALDRLVSDENLEEFRRIGQIVLVAFNSLSFTIQNNLLPALGNLARAFGLPTPSIRSLGDAIIYVTQVINLLIIEISKWIDTVAVQFANSFDELAANTFDWGFNIIETFAEGMASAAKFVVDVLITIGNFIANLLQAFSPPKLLPDLPKWGAAALTSYMQGWLEGDFSVFDDIAGLIEDFLRSIPDTLFDEVDVVPAILDMRDAVAQAINSVREFGAVTDDILQRVFRSIIGVTPAMKEYIRLTLELELANQDVVEAQEEMARANEILAKAQENLTKVTEEYDEIIADLNEELRPLEDRGDELDDLRKITQLQLILNDVNASALDKERARIEIEKIQKGIQLRAVEAERDAAVKAAEDKVDAAEDVVKSAEENLLEAERTRDAILEQAIAYEELIKVEIDQNRLVQEQIDLLRRLAEAAKGAGDGLGGLDVELPDFGELDIEEKLISPFEAAEAKLEALRFRLAGRFAEIRKTIEAALNELPGKIAEILGPLTEPFEGISESLETLRSTWSITFTEIVETVPDIIGSFSGLAGPINTFADAFDRIPDILKLFLERVPGFALELKGWEGLTPGQENFALALGIVGGAIEALGRFIDNQLTKIYLFGLAIVTLNDAVVDLKSGDVSGAVEKFKGFFAEMRRVADEDTRAMTGFVEGFEEASGAAIERFSTDAFKILDQTWIDLNSSTQTWSDDSVDIMEGWRDLLVGESVIPETMDAIFNVITSRLGDILSGFGDWTGISGWVDDFVTDLDPTKLYTAGVDLIDGLLDGIQYFWENTLVPWVEDNFGWLIDLLNQLGDMGSPSRVMRESGVNLIKGLQIGIEETFGGPLAAIDRLGNAIFGRAEGMQNAFAGLSATPQQVSLSMDEAVLDASEAFNAPAQALSSFGDAMMTSTGMLQSAFGGLAATQDQMSASMVGWGADMQRAFGGLAPAQGQTAPGMRQALASPAAAFDMAAGRLADGGTIMDRLASIPSRMAVTVDTAAERGILSPRQIVSAPSSVANTSNISETNYNIQMPTTVSPAGVRQSIEALEVMTR